MAGMAEAARGAALGGASANRYGRVSELRLLAREREGRTVVPELFCTQPFKVMHPFAVDAETLPGLSRAAADVASPLFGCKPAQVMVMSVSAGIMAGDEQRIDVRVEPGAAMQAVTQAFEKIHRMGEGESARRSTRIAVSSGAYLDYSPLPQVPFAGSSFASGTSIDLADASSRLVYSEMLSCGRAARGERFAYRRYRNRVRIEVAGDPVFIDNTVYEPMGGALGAPVDMEGIGFYEGFTHLANLVLVNLDVDGERFEAMRAYLREQTGVIGASAVPVDATSSEAVAGGITRLESGACLVKLLGHRAQRLQQVMAGVRALL